MPVYMIQGDSKFGPVKIGHSQWPDVRLGQLQISHWETLRIIRLFEGGEAEEIATHARFDDLWIRGEWHNFSRAMLGDVGLVEIIPEIPFTVSPDAAVAMDIIRPQRGLMAKLADDLGVTRAAVAKWRQVPASRVLKVSELTGLSRHELRPDLYPEPTNGERA